MKCISVRQPYGSWLANPDKFVKANLTPKRIENRNWTTNYRGPILIHASKTFEYDAIPFWLQRFPRLGDAFSLDPKDYPLGAIIGHAKLVNVITSLENAVARDPWFCGEYGFKLVQAGPIEPIPYRGSLMIFEVPESVLAGIAR
jgi:hypothetical protein